MPDPEINVSHDPDGERYVITVDGEQAGLTQYRLRPGLIAFIHTEIDEQREGQNLGSQLIGFALDDARRQGLAVLPFCPFVNAYIQRHPDYADLVPSEHRERFEVVSEKTYKGEQLDVTFDAARCLHAAECVRRLPAVFDTERRPWISPDGASATEVAEVVARCPSGALHVGRSALDAEPHGPVAIDAAADAPLFARGDLRLETSDGALDETRAALCRCGKTANAPFCDASGPCTGWRDSPG